MLYLFFFFKQKTAYEMRISDWSSDVCSSDLSAAPTLSRSSAIRAWARLDAVIQSPARASSTAMPAAEAPTVISLVFQLEKASASAIDTVTTRGRSARVCKAPGSGKLGRSWSREKESEHV